MSPLSSSVSTNTENISSLSTAVGKLQSDVNAIDKSPRKTYEATYGDITLDDGTVQESMFTLWETEGVDEPTVKSRFKIVGGGGGGAAAGNNLTISYEEFPEEGIKVLTVARGEEAIEMFEGDLAVVLYRLLTGKGE